MISALKHSCIETDQKLKLIMIESSSLEKETLDLNPGVYHAAWESLRSADGILVPGEEINTEMIEIKVNNIN